MVIMVMMRLRGVSCWQCVHRWCHSRCDEASHYSGSCDEQRSGAHCPEKKGGGDMEQGASLEKYAALNVFRWGCELCMAIMTRAPTQRPEKRRLLPTPAVEQPSYEQCCKRSSQSRQLRRANFGVRYVVSAKEPNGSTGAARAALELDPLGYPLLTARLAPRHL